MILEGYKRKNVIKQFKKSLANPSNDKTLYSNKIENVFLFVENEIDQKLLESLSVDLGVSLSKIEFLIFKERIDKKETLEHCVSKNDFGLFGKLSNDEIRKTLEVPHDLLLNFTQENEFISNMVAISNSGFKVGLLDSYSEVYDLIIDVKRDDVDTFGEELKKYLKILNKL